MTLKEIVANEEMQVVLQRGQEQGFLGIEEVAAALANRGRAAWNAGRNARAFADLDRAIKEMIEHPGLVIVDVIVENEENCFPMIPSGKAHNDMILAELGDDAGVDIGAIIDEKGKMLV